MPGGRKTAKKCNLDQLLEDDDVELTSKAHSRKKSIFNLFEKKRVKGWWPAAGEDREGKRILAVSYWQQGFVTDFCHGLKWCCLFFSSQGKMELEFEIVTEEEEQLRPAGRAREEPNMNPHLDEPQ